MKHFRLSLWLAKNLLRFGWSRGAFGGHFDRSILPGLKLSFSARQNMILHQWRSMRQRGAIIPGHPVGGIRRQFYGVPLQLDQVLERVGIA